MSPLLLDIEEVGMAVITIQPGSMSLVREYCRGDDGHLRFQQKLFLKVHILRLFLDIRLRLYRPARNTGRPVDAVPCHSHRQGGLEHEVVKSFIAIAYFTVMALVAVAVMPESNLAIMAGAAELSAPVTPLGDLGGIPLHQKIQLTVTYTTREFCAMQPVRKIYRLLPVCFRSPVDKDIAKLLPGRKRR